MMSALSRLARSASTLTAADVEAAVQRGVEKALAGHPKQDMPPAAPQGHRMRALMRAMQPPMPAPERPTAPAPVPAATAHRAEAAVAPRPMPNIPMGEIPVVMHYDELGRVSGFDLGDMFFKTARDANGRISTVATSDGFGTKVTRRDANGKVAGLLMMPPRGMR